MTLKKKKKKGTEAERWKLNCSNGPERVSEDEDTWDKSEPQSKWRKLVRIQMTDLETSLLKNL